MDTNNQIVNKIYNVSEKLYQSDADRELNNIIAIIEEITISMMDTVISKENTQKFNSLVSDILNVIQAKDWIFAGDILRYQLTEFVKEAF